MSGGQNSKDKHKDLELFVYCIFTSLGLIKSIKGEQVDGVACSGPLNHSFKVHSHFFKERTFLTVEPWLAWLCFVSSFPHSKCPQDTLNSQP